MKNRRMKNFIFGILIVILLLSIGLFAWAYNLRHNSRASSTVTTMPPKTVTPTAPQSGQSVPATTVIADHLDTPWGIAILPDKQVLVTERPGRVTQIDPSGKTAPIPVATLPNVKEYGEGGLLGIVLHPNFTKNNYVYFYYTYSSNGTDTLNRVVRMTYQDHKLSAEKIIVDAIPGSLYHDGGRIKFGPDGYLYIGTGDAQAPSQAQDKQTLGGKILRVTDEGKPAPGNPFGNDVYSYGHRNVQGLAWDSAGNLWATEHGRSTPTGYDEVNRIEAGKNYGWPTIQGDETKAGMQTPVINSGPTTTWAPSGASFVGNSLFFGGLKGETLYEAVISDNKVTTLKKHLTGQFGRLRDVVATPDGLLYITTSNQDSRGTPTSADDRIIKVNPQKL